jgi:hypothetical protein
MPEEEFETAKESKRAAVRTRTARKQPASKPKLKPKAAIEPTPKERAIPEVVAPDEELTLLREFALFVLNTAKSVSVDPKDHDHWKTLRGQVRKIVEGHS